MLRIKKSAAWITIYWFIISLSFGIILGLIAESNASGGEQKLFTYIADSLLIGFIGMALINTYSLLFGNNLNKDRGSSIALLVIALIILIPIIFGTFFNKYIIEEQTRYNGSNEIDIKKEYYPQNKINDTVRHIRSEKFWENGKRDSTWSVYAKDGSLMSRRKYSNGKLIETTK